MSEAAPKYSPSAARNRDPILDVLRRHMPERGLVLEIASGSGEHAVHFASAFPGLTWQPSDRDSEALASVAAHRAMAGLENLLPPLPLDVSARPWPVETADVVVSINMIHIAPWSAGLDLIAGAGALLRPSGKLVLYGPFKEGGRHSAESNAAFDADLQSRDPQWGVRDLEAVVSAAESHGLTLIDRITMPANNLTIVFQRAS